MRDAHLWICGGGRAAAAAGAAAEHPDSAADCDRRLRGPYTGTGTMLRQLVPAVHERRPGLAARHAIGILAAAPELAELTGPAPETLTSAAAGERTRWYSRYRTRRIAHGLADFLRECAADRPLTLYFGAADRADFTDQEFLAVALRRLDPARVRLIVATGPAAPRPELRDALAAHCKRQEPAPAPPALAAADPAAAAAAFVASDGTSDVPGEREAYLDADLRLRERLHAARAAELEARGEYSLALGAIPYHLRRGGGPASAVRAAHASAAWYCIGMAFYDAGLELAREHAALIDPDEEPEAWVAAQVYVTQCLAMLDRPAETEEIFWESLARTASPVSHMNISYGLAILFTRMYGPEHKDHHRALAHMNTAVAIASQLPGPADRAFHTVFMNNGKALVAAHLGRPGEALALVTEGIERLDRELPPDVHRLHRSVLRHNRAQVLAGLGRAEEALADFGHVVAVDPNYPEYWFDRANLLVKLGRHDEALADYAEAMRLTPPFPELYYNRGDARAAAGDLPGAVADFRYVLDLEPDYLEARVSLASVLLDAGDPHAAAAEARAGLAVTPGEARLHCTLGLALLELAEHEAARQAFDRALELDPGLTEALVNRAVVAYEQGAFDVAAAGLTQALDADPGNPDLLYNRGLAGEAAGRAEQAVADYTAALAHDAADRPALLYQRGRCLAALGRPDAARADLQASLDLGAAGHQEEVRGLLAAGG